MDLPLKKFLQINCGMDGAVLFGSQLKKPDTNSDTDIVLFDSNPKVFHTIEYFENRVFDVFRMSLDHAFHQLRLRHPLWLSAFSTGTNLSDNPTVDLLLKTALEIVTNQKPAQPPEILNKLLFSFDYSFSKLCKSVDSEFFYLHYSSHFLNNAKDCLFYAKGIYVHNMASQMHQLTSDFGSLSEDIKSFLRQSDILQKHRLAESIYNQIRQLCPAPVQYPIVISHS